MALVVLAFRMLSPAFPKVVRSRRIAALLLSLLVGGAGAAATFAFAGRRDSPRPGRTSCVPGPSRRAGRTS